MIDTERELLFALKSYSDSDPARFHMPGHKGQNQFPPIENLAAFDVTEISETDDLNSPDGVLMRLEAKFAKLYDAKNSFLLVNGSTSGNIAMLLSLGTNKRVLLARNCHKSVISGIALAGHSTVSIFPDFETGIVTPSQIETVLKLECIDAVFITSPTYYGCCCDIDAIAGIVHSYGAKLYVDCAHGAHFPFLNELPNVPKAADAWVVSCHKTLGSFTQTAILNIGKSNDISQNRMQSCISMVQSSSPSYLMMLSLENVLYGVGDWKMHVERIKKLREEIDSIYGVSLLAEKNSFNGNAAFEFDITRLTICVHGMSGYEFASFLEKRRIFVEMADISSVVLITTPFDPDEWYSRLKAAIFEAALEKGKDEYTLSPTDFKTLFTENTEAEKILSVREAIFAVTESIELEKSAGRICAAAVGVYPPGIAMLFPGERIEKNAIEKLLLLIKNGARPFGMSGNKIYVVKAT